MIKKMVQHGNSSALIIEKPLMEILNINSDTQLEIVTDGTNLIISPVPNNQRLQKLETSLAKINKNHKKTLFKLGQ